MSLCLTCRNSIVSENQNGTQLIHCMLYESNIRKKIVKCSGYSDKNEILLREHEDLAWIKLGEKFVPFRSLNYEERNRIGFDE